MGYNAAAELGKLIGQGLAEANKYKEDFIETDEITDIDLYGIENINIVGSGFVYISELSTSSFVLDHPVYGYLDSSTLSIDGGYSSSGTVLYSSTLL